MQNKRRISKAYKTALMVFAGAMLVTQLAAWIFFQGDKSTEQLIVQQEAENVKNRVEHVLNNSVKATKILAFLIDNDLLNDNYFDIFSEQLIAKGNHIDALQLVRDSIITDTYPLEGNEATIGYEVLADSMHYQEAMIALERRRLYFEGPFDLIQGGRGIVGRLPIIKDDEYWGFSAAVILLETMLEAIEMDPSGMSKRFIYQIKKKRSDTYSAVFFEGVTGYDEGIYHNSLITMGDWEVYVKLRNPRYQLVYAMMAMFGLFLSSVVAMYAYNLSAQPEKLQLLVDEKTRDLEQLNREIQEHVKELELSNQELEQFAYIASHDLQEPLRMVTSFVGRIRDKYGDQLDEKGQTYIHFAVDGANRMRQIILDLLEYSRVGRESQEKLPVDLNRLLEEYELSRKKWITEKQAIIQYDKLPVVTSYVAPITQIFHNLLDNALKYSSKNRSPEIRVTATDQGDHWLLAISDNGIGIEKEYFEKIFIIFNRLHTKEVYEGTGIGLAIVRKIITNMNEQVWLESEPGKGSTFYFTLRKDL